MNRKLIIVISAATAVLIGLLIAISIFQSKPLPTGTVPDQVTFPTGMPRRGSGDNALGDKLSTIPKEDLDTLYTIQSKLPYESESLTMDYSALTGKIYIEKKNDNADEELNKFLEANGLKELYDNNPHLFKSSSTEIKNRIINDEQSIMPDNEQLPDTSNPTPTPTPTPNPNDPTRDIKPVLNTFKTLMGFNTVLTKPTSSPPSQQSSQTSQAQNPPAQNPPVQILTGANTSNVPCSAGSDNGVVDGYRNGTLTKIRICRVKGFVVNSQISKQFNDMTNAAAATGISFIAPGFSGSFRTMSGQISTYQRWCKSNGIVGSPPPYPKAPGQTIRCPGGGAPGYSNHQMGMAFDLGCNGVPIPRSYKAASQNRCFNWLTQNAERYGFFEYGYGKTRDGSTGYEGWHWSINGN